MKNTTVQGSIVKSINIKMSRDNRVINISVKDTIVKYILKLYKFQVEKILD